MNIKRQIWGVLTASVCALVLLSCTRDAAIGEKAKPAPPAVEYVSTWGVKGSSPGQLNDPGGIATDYFGNVYVANSGNRSIEKFSAEGNPLLSFQDDALKQPESIGIDSGGGIYVTDPSRGSAIVFFPEGDRYRELHFKNRPSAEDFLGVTIGADAKVHVLDGDVGRVFNFMPPPFRAAGSWAIPGSVPARKNNYGPVFAAPDGYVYVANPSANKILRLTEGGGMVSEIPLAPREADERSEAPFTVYNGHVLVVTANGRVLQVFSADGKAEMTATLGSDDNGAGRDVRAIAVSARRDLFILEGAQARILRFRINF